MPSFLRKEVAGIPLYVWLILGIIAVAIGLYLRRKSDKGGTELYNAETYPIPGQVAPPSSDDNPPPSDNSNPIETKPPVAQTVSVPNIVGMPAEVNHQHPWKDTLTAAGLKVGTFTKLKPGVGDEHLKIKSENPPAGSSVSVGTVVNGTKG